MKEYKIIIYEDGTKEWQLNGKKLTEEEFNARKRLKELTVAEIEKLLGHPVKIINEK